jgi:hypothetical protein
MNEEFQNIPISDVLITCNIETGDQGAKVNFGIEYAEPLPLSMYAIYALPPGIPVGVADIVQGPVAHPDCFIVFIATDQRAMWGRKCPHCDGYWRTSSPGLAATTVCCYCGQHLAAHDCLSDAQRAYVSATCAYYNHLLREEKPGKHSIKARDLLNRGVTSDGSPLPPRFFVEQSKQTQFTCDACGNRNDILGRFGYCSSCGTRNDAALFAGDISKARDAINAGMQLTTALKEAVDGFDTIGRNIAQQLCHLVPMTAARRVKWERANFAQLSDVAEALRIDFDIDLLKSLDA